MAASDGPGQDSPLASAKDELDYAGLIEALEEGVIVLRGSRVLAVNPSLARIVGASPRSLVGRPLGDLLTDLEGSPIEIGGASEAARLRSARGDLVPVSLRVVGPELLIVRDRSRERVLQQEVWRTGRSPGAGSDDGSLEALLAMVEHEIRTPVTVVSGYARMLLDGREGALNDVQTEFLLAIRRAAGRIEGLLDNLLEIGRGGDPTAVPVLRKPTSLRTLIRGAVEAIRPRAEERGLRVALDLDPEADLLYADPLRFEQLLTNLLANAAKFAPDGTTVHVATGLGERDGKETIWVEVQDAGPGIDPEEAERIFEPFTRGRAAAETSVQGVGLGLAICRRIVVAHGGSIEAVPSRGGALLRVTVPAGA